MAHANKKKVVDFGFLQYLTNAQQISDVWGAQGGKGTGPLQNSCSQETLLHLLLPVDDSQRKIDKEARIQSGVNGLMPTTSENTAIFF